MEEAAAPLREAWYYAAPSRAVRRGRLLSRVLLGDPVVLGRGADGAVFALHDICPHRGMPLSAGSFDGREIECCYHGWRFAADGACTAIPALVDGQKFDLARICVRAYPAREVQGNIWVYLGDRPDTAPDIPILDGFGADAEPRIVEQMSFTASVDDAVVGLMDPAHGPFVHRAWWWRGRHSIHEKAKPFVPSPWGFTMSRHAPSTNSRAYKILGGAPSTEIAFRLPSVRVEQIRTGRHAVCNLTAITPIDHKTSEINHCIYWTAPWLSALKPMLRPYVRAFLRQDRDVMEKQQQGLRYNPTLSLIDDADTQARWYYRLKREYRRSIEEGRGFENPVEAKTLHWRS
ncbi:MAG TPA: aromatic ring-hydroxylating dioxygenase subunit alpha [Stellaceae bacterium]|nr:aromatic ring-hydroxylating dioxygenase subunit alpha [Stellaceae bacterium]